MKFDRQIDKLIDNYTPAIIAGQETIDSILEKYPEYARELRPRLEAVFWLVNTRKKLAPRQGFISSSRKTIEDHFDAVQPRGTWQRMIKRHTPLRWAFNISAPLVLVLLVALIINNLILASRLTLPGDPLYTTKLFLEDIRIISTFNPIDKTDLYIELSRERTTEFVNLVLEGDYEVLPAAANRLEKMIIASLHSIDDLSMRDLTNKQPETSELRETLTNEIFMLNVLKSSSPPLAYPGIELAIQVAQSGLMVLR